MGSSYAVEQAEFLNVTGAAASEKLIVDVPVNLLRVVPIPGRLFVSLNHLYFHSNVLGKVTRLVVPFDDIVSVETANTALIVPNAIVLSTVVEKYWLTHLTLRDTIFAILDHLSTFRPTRGLPKTMRSVVPTGSEGLIVGGLDAAEERERLFGDALQRVEDRRRDPSHERKLYSAKPALQAAERARESGVASLEMLQTQREQILHARNAVRKIQGNLDTSDRLLTGMESIFGAVKLVFRSKKTHSSATAPLSQPPEPSSSYSSVRSGGTASRRDHETQESPRGTRDNVGRGGTKTRLAISQDLDVPILHRKPGRLGSSVTYTPGQLRFRVNSDIMVHTTLRGEEVNRYFLETIEDISIDSRPLHVTFHLCGTITFEMMSSRLPEMVDQLMVRKTQDNVATIETSAQGESTHSFLRGLLSNERSELFAGGTRSGPDGGGGGGESRTTGGASLQEQIAEQDRDLDKISAVLADLKDIAITTGEELDIHKHHLDALTEEVDAAGDRIHRTTRRVNKLS